MDRIKIVKEYTAVIKEIDRKERTITALTSTGEKDRVGEYIPPAEWKLANYEKNPVLLWAHKYDQPAIGKALWTKITPEGLLQKFQFAKHAFAQDIYELYADKFMTAFSVGFMSNRDEQDSTILRNCELLETSAVPVPCNPNALALALRSNAGMLHTVEALSFVKELVAPELKAIEEKEAAAKEAAVKTAFVEALQKEMDLLKAENELLTKQAAEVKEGRVLSEKNRKIIATAHKALAELLAAAEPAQNSAPAETQKGIDNSEKIVIITDKKQTEPSRSGISAELIAEAVKKINIGEIVSREIRRIKGEV